MSDVNDTADVASVNEPTTTAETETAQPESQQVKQTTEVKASATEARERMVPISVVQKERKERQELQRKLAGLESMSKLGQYSEDDMSAIMSHPFVQEMMLKQAKYELTEYAKGLLDEHPEIPEPVKRAIVANVRGFVKETTADVDSAKIDIQEYIDSLVEQGLETPQPPKQFPVVSTKAPETSTSTKPAEIQQILEKPVDEWSEDENKLVDQYKKTVPKR